VLILLDNARSVEQVRPLLPGGPGCLVLVTSRDRLSGLVAKDGARRLTLDMLTPADAQALLTRLLGEERVGSEPHAVAALARVSAYLPLALRIAAASLADQPSRRVAAYAATLGAENRLAALEVEGDERAAVRAAFHLSYATLDPDTQRLFRLLGLVPGPDVTAEAAAALADLTPQRARRLLDRLAAAHLLGQHAPGRYAFHDLLRLYATEQVQREDGQDERHTATARLFAWYLYTADAAGRLLYPEALRLPLRRDEPQPPQAVFDDHGQALAWLDAERPNLIAAVRHATEHGPHAIAWRLAGGLHRYLYLRIHTVDSLAVAHAGLTAAVAQGALPAQAAAHLSLGDAHLAYNGYQQAIEHYSRALTLARQSSWLEGEAVAIGNLGAVYGRSGRLQQAADHHLQALAVNRRSGRLAGQAVNLHHLGIVCQELGRLREAADHLAEALVLHRRLGSRSGEAVAASWLGGTEHALGRLDEALHRLTHALALHREVGDQGNEADTLRALAAVHRDAGRHAHALDLAHAALALARDTGERRVEADALNTVASVHQRLAQHRQAADHYQQALRLARATETRYPEVEALIGAATVHQQLGHPTRAFGDARLGLTVSRQAGFRLLEGEALTTLAGLHLDANDPDQAIHDAQQALALHRQTGHRLGEARTLRILGHAQEQTGDSSGGRACLQRAGVLFKEIGSPVDPSVT
jgi:tetratricopeptide (TPR) repeat protein